MNEFVRQDPDGPDGIANQGRLNELKALAKVLHEAIVKKHESIEGVMDSVMTEKGKVAGRIPVLSTDIGKVDGFIASLEGEAKARQVNIDKLTAELSAIKKTIAQDNAALVKNKAELDTEKKNWRLHVSIPSITPAPIPI